MFADSRVTLPPGVGTRSRVSPTIASAPESPRTARSEWRPSGISRLHGACSRRVSRGSEARCPRALLGRLCGRDHRLPLPEVAGLKEKFGRGQCRGPVQLVVRGIALVPARCSSEVQKAAIARRALHLNKADYRSRWTGSGAREPLVEDPLAVRLPHDQLARRTRQGCINEHSTSMQRSRN